ncbi:GerAB/ArcD/ProY family transporter [Paenibacillus sedimenti]|uniref:GerAB/ArcD/ProY family transporter n=1 Tax=Paenibacillus sedimenti TaxID=2770274 RepID=A0A926KM69_9BACL|nr:GerAB/ArcD/ProY family transporter [Paenibacillus sedimenti]
MIGILRICFGNVFGSILGGCFTIYFAYESMRNVRDFGEITTITLLSKTSSEYHDLQQYGFISHCDEPTAF